MEPGHERFFQNDHAKHRRQHCTDHHRYTDAQRRISREARGHQAGDTEQECGYFRMQESCFSGETSSIAMLRIVSSFPAATWLSEAHA